METVIASTGIIQLNYGEIIHFDFDYKGYTAFSLEWSNNTKMLAVFEPEELKCNITFEGTEEEYNEYVQPLVDLYNQKLQENQQDDILQANLRLENYDATIKAYQQRILIALANGDSELVTQLQNEMNGYDPKINTQDLNDINHYCKKCGHDLDAFNVCSNENCKRKELQDELVQLIHDKN